jgi:hypothetical protein
MNAEEENRPEWWEVEVGNLIADPEALRDLLDDLTMSITYWRHEAERARSLCVVLEGELAQREAGS